MAEQKKTGTKSTFCMVPYGGNGDWEKNTEGLGLLRMVQPTAKWR